MTMFPTPRGVLLKKLKLKNAQPAPEEAGEATPDGEAEETPAAPLPGYDTRKGLDAPTIWGGKKNSKPGTKI